MKPWVPLTIISVASLVISSFTLILVYPISQATPPTDLIPQEIQNDTAKPKFLRERVEHFFTTIESRNATAVHSFYHDSDDTTLRWHRQAGVFAGNYTYESIFQIYNILLSRSIDIQMGFDNYNATFINDDRVIVEMMVFSSGLHDMYGDFLFEASATTNWEYVNDEWVMVKDNWEFQRWNWEIPPPFQT